jgi:salicylate hydroxylase
MAIEDAGAIGILFNKDYFNGNVAETLAIYNDIRLPRVSKVQAAAYKAASNINERIGKSLFSRSAKCILCRRSW